MSKDFDEEGIKEALDWERKHFQPNPGVSAPQGDAREADAEKLRKAIRWMSEWVREAMCDCEDGHICGIQERAKECAEAQQAWERMFSMPKVRAALESAPSASPEGAVEPKAQCQNCEAQATCTNGFGYVCESCWRAANEGYGRGLIAEENGHVPRGFGDLRTCAKCGLLVPTKSKCKGKVKIGLREAPQPTGEGSGDLDFNALQYAVEYFAGNALGKSNRMRMEQARKTLRHLKALTSLRGRDGLTNEKGGDRV